MAEEQQQPQPEMTAEELRVLNAAERRLKRQQEAEEARRQGIMLGTTGAERWGSLAEKRIRDAIEAGEFDNLRGAGKPQEKDEYDNPFLPDDQKMAMSMLRHNGVVPDWVQFAQEIERDRSGMTTYADNHFAMLRRRLSNLSSLPFVKMRNEVDSLKRSHTAATSSYRQRLLSLNEKINRFNMMCPVATLAQETYAVDSCMAAWQRRTPAYLEY